MRNKNNIRKSTKDYQTWIEKRGGYDPLSLEGLGESASPYDEGVTPPVLDDIYEKLSNLYYNGHFKGRQKQILDLLFEGETNQTVIAKRLNMKQNHVSDELKKIMKIIS